MRSLLSALLSLLLALPSLAWQGASPGPGWGGGRHRDGEKASFRREL